MGRLTKPTTWFLITLPIACVDDARTVGQIRDAGATSSNSATGGASGGNQGQNSGTAGTGGTRPDQRSAVGGTNAPAATATGGNGVTGGTGTGPSETPSGGNTGGLSSTAIGGTSSPTGGGGSGLGGTSAVIGTGGSGGVLGTTTGGTGVASTTFPSQSAYLVHKAFDLTGTWANGVMSLHFTSASGDSLQGIIEARNQAHAVGFTQTGDGTWTADGTITMYYLPQGANMCDSYDRLSLATLTALQLESDTATQITLSGSLDERFCSDDYSSSSKSQLTLAGNLLARAPKWTFYSPATFSPTDALSFGLDTPLDPAATATLSVAGGASIPLSGTWSDGVIVGFSTSVVLPLSSKIELTSTGPALCTNLVPVSATISTLADPGIFPMDGFESGLQTGIIKGTSRTTFAGLSPITGTRSLSIGPSASVIQIARPAGTTSVGFTIRRIDNLSSTPCSAGTLTVSAGVVGASGLSSSSINTSADYVTVSDGTTSYVAYAAQDVRLSLTSAGDTVLLMFEPISAFPPLCGRDVYAWIDDVRLQ